MPFVSSLSFDGYSGIDTLSFEFCEPVHSQLYPSQFVVNIADINSANIRNFENITGHTGPDRLVGNDLNNTIIGLDGDDTIIGGGGNDILIGNGGFDLLYGDNGIDTAVYTYSRVNYSLTHSGSGSIYVNSISGDESQDKLFQVERLRFSDIQVAYDTASDQAAGKALLVVASLFGKDFLQDKILMRDAISFFQDSPSLEYGISKLINIGVIKNFVGDSIEHVMLKISQNVPDITIDSISNEAASVSGSRINDFYLSKFISLSALSEANILNVDLTGIGMYGVEYSI